MARFSETQGLSFLVLDELAPSGVDAVVTTRPGGVSEGPYNSLNLGLHVGDVIESVVENRSRVAKALGVSLDDCVFMNQVHGTRVSVVGHDLKGRGSRFEDNAVVGTDALVTTIPGIPLVVLVADCCPVAIVDKENRILGVAHAGWRGTASGVAQAVIEAMQQLGGDPSGMSVVIGPSIERARYEVGDEVVDALARTLPADKLDFVDRSMSQPHVDVAAVNVAQLVSLGIPRESITISEIRTGDARFFSDRAMRPCGRFGLVASLVA